MPKTLAELRASNTAQRPERRKELCLAHNLVAEVQRLQEERRALVVEIARTTPADDDGKPRRLARGGNTPAIKAIDDRLDEVYAEMREASGELLLRATTAGEWFRFRGEHPARKDNPVDERVAFGYINADELANALDAYVVSYNGEPVDAETWQWILSVALPADINDIVTTVVSMHEGSISVPKLPTSSSANPTSAPG